MWKPGARSTKIIMAVGSRTLFYGSILLGAWWWMLWTPGPECVPPLEALNADEAGFEREVRSDISFLAGTIGERNLSDKPEELEQAAAFIDRSLGATGYRPLSQWYTIRGAKCRNVVAEIRGTVAATSVTFNGVAASLVYVSPNQINAILPFSLAAQTSLQVAVQRFERVSAPVTVTLQDTAPAIFTAAQTGTGQAVVLQQPPNGRLSYNSSNNPVHAGDYLEIFATGQGLWTPPPQSDVVVFSGKLPTTPPVSLTIGGQPATIVYTGPVGGLSIWSVLQVNAIVPNGLSPGDQPLVLRIGSNDNAQQKVTVAVR